ncbi:MAG: type sorting protein [Ignavibacteria bacterium]|nr:type sorting protein [Ignavibacteria bacterium]
MMITNSKNIKIICIRISLLFLFFQLSLKAQTVFFTEYFDDNSIASRGWYDNTIINISSTERHGTSGSAAEFKFLKGARTPQSGGGIRRLFTPSDEVYLSYWVKYSSNWVGSQKPYHPHEFSFVTTINDKWVGPAYTHLTTYIEQNNGKPMLSLQDGQNIDETKINVELKDITESRAVAGCNGTGDSYPKGDCYLQSLVHFNGKSWKAARQYFTDTINSKYYKNDWHHVEAYFKLNSIQSGKGVPDGTLRYWYDEELIINAPNVLLRTGSYPDMKFNQFLIVPYIGDGSPIEQTMWVDDLTVASSRPVNNIQEEKNANKNEIQVTPNPLNESSVLTFHLNKTEEISIIAFDYLGREILLLNKGRMEAGICEFELSPLYNLMIKQGIKVAYIRLMAGSESRMIIVVI